MSRFILNNQKGLRSHLGQRIGSEKKKLRRGLNRQRLVSLAQSQGIDVATLRQRQQ